MLKVIGVWNMQRRRMKKRTGKECSLVEEPVFLL